ncbi:DNA binding protein [Microbacterium phage Luna18]|nr:hypothetical protein SEA_KATCHAN_50 [Microbacterium phage KatChan]URQ04901.1 DNA binding protein [Microbacterium phage Luna18]
METYKSAHALRAKQHQDDIQARIEEKRAAARARCRTGDHTVINGTCIVCKLPQ